MDFFSMFRRPNKSNKTVKKSTGSLAKSRLARPDFEPLEDRMMLSANTISGYVYHDANHNGLFDPSETPIVNANLELHNSLGQVIATATSDANGFYQFTNDSTINTNPVTMDQTVTIPSTLAGFTINKQVNQFDPSLGQLLEVDIIHDGSITSAIKAENTSTLVGSPITGLVSGQMFLNGPGFSINATVSQNAGSFQASVFDGVIDFGGTSGKDFGPSTAVASTKMVTLSGAQLNAFIGTGQLSLTEQVDVNSTATGGGNLVANITSTATATFTVRYKYIPSNALRPGNYTIVETQQPSLPGGLGTYLDGLESQNGLVLPNSIGTDVIPVALTNNNSPNNNFGELLPARLAGFAYDDANNNGVMDPTETGIAGVTLTLTGTDDNGQFITRTALTAADGSYLFDNLRPGFYAIQETQPNGYLDGKDMVGTPGGQLSNDRISGINLSQGTAGAHNDFGELLPASLAGFVYSDVNYNGNKDPGEPGIAGATITLTGTDDLGSVLRITQTGADGSFKFDNLRPGVYSIQETQPANFLDGTDTIGSLGGNTSNDLFSTIAPQQGQHGTDYDFGEINPTSLAGTVWHDADDNGIFDNGETGIAGVTIKLTGTTAGGSPVTMLTTTAADGSYNFANLQAGTYTIQETQPAGWMDGKDSLGTAGGTMSNDKFANIALQAGIIGTEYNFGELLSGSLAGHVWRDDNNDGIMDPGENGIANVKVTLTGINDLGAAVTRTTTTAADGSYRFGNLRPGTYSLQETQPLGWIDGKDALGSLGGTKTNDRFGNVAVNDSQDGTDYNFGERLATDLGITKRVSPTTAQPGATLTYKMVITNFGLNDAQNVQVDDQLPAGVIFVTAKATGWTLNLVGGHIIFTRDVLAVGTSSTITITAVAPLTPGYYTNIAVVSTTSFDNNSYNNQAKAKVQVVNPPTEVSPPPAPICPPNSIILSSDATWLALLRKSLGL